MSYLIVREADDGSWLNDPAMFDFQDQAEAYAVDRADLIKPGQSWVLYECREINFRHKGAA